jgi:hypothetical protein
MSIHPTDLIIRPRIRALDWSAGRNIGSLEWVEHNPLRDVRPSSAIR